MTPSTPVEVATAPVPTRVVAEVPVAPPVRVSESSGTGLVSDPLADSVAFPDISPLWTVLGEPVADAPFV